MIFSTDLFWQHREQRKKVKLFSFPLKFSGRKGASMVAEFTKQTAVGRVQTVTASLPSRNNISWSLLTLT